MRQILNNKTGSPLEDLMLEEFLEIGLSPKLQYPVDIFFIDFAFPDKKLAIEADGFKYHSPKKDNYKNKRLAELGWKVERFAGWFLHKYKYVAVSQIALKYFMEELSDKQKKLAMGSIANCLARNDKKLAERYIKSLSKTL